MLIVLYYFHLVFYNKNFIRSLFFQQVILKSDTETLEDKITFIIKGRHYSLYYSHLHEFTMEFTKVYMM